MDGGVPFKDEKTMSENHDENKAWTWISIGDAVAAVLASIGGAK